MFPFLIRRLTFPLHQHFTHRSTLSALKQLRESQGWSVERLRSFQQERLRHILTYAASHVPHYRDRFTEQNLHPESAADKEWLRIPVMTKTIVREHFDRLQTTDRGRLFITGKSSGSTGRPVTWHIDRNATSMQQAAHLRTREWWGFNLGDPHVLLWGRDIFQGHRKEFRDLVIWNKRALSGMEISENLAALYYHKLKKYRPRFLRGYPSLFARFARLCEKQNLSLKDLSLRAIITTAETLTPAQRLEIQATYRCPVVNEYGCSEVQLIAFECPKGSMHIQSDVIRVEFLRDDQPVNPGELGEITVTDLTNEIMPVIRYKTGDFGRPREGLCPCGRTLPLMELTIGRMVDLIKLPNGRVIHSEVFTPVHNSLLFKLVQQFQVLQEAPTQFRIQVIVQSADDFQTVQKEFTQLITAELGGDIELTLERVSEIPRTPSGKQPYFISHLAEMLRG